MAEYDSVIPAGGSGKLVARVHTNANQQGRLSKSIMVTTDAPDAKNVRLLLSFNLVAPIQVTPRTSLLINATEGQSGSAKVLLHRTDDKPLEIIRTDVGIPDLIDVQLRPVEAAGAAGAKPGDVWLEASYSHQKQAVSRSTKLTVYTNHPDQPVLQLPVTVRVRRLIEPRPSRLTLWLPAKYDGGQVAPLQLTHNNGKPFEIRKLEASHPMLFTAKALSNDAQRTHQIRVELVKGAEKAALKLPIRGHLRISSSDPQRPVIEVPVTVAQRRVRARPQARKK